MFKKSVGIKQSVLAIVLAASGCAGSSQVENIPSVASVSRITETEYTADHCVPDVLNSTYDFNVFVSGDIYQPSSDTQGRMAVGGNATLAAYSVGDALPADRSRLDLIVQGNLIFPSGAVMSGGAVCQGIATVNPTTSFYGGLQSGAVPLDFAAADTFFKNLSNALAALPASGTVDLVFTGGSRAEAIFTGQNPVLNVFTLTADQLAHVHTLRLTVPAGSTAIINAPGPAAEMQQFEMFLSGITAEKVIFHFPEARTLALAAIAVEGSVLAPYADTTFVAGQLNGQFIARSMAGAGQFNHRPFSGCLPFREVTPSPSPSPTPTLSAGCTYTIGYWKNHAEEEEVEEDHHGRIANAMGPLLPQRLGAAGGVTSLNVSSLEIGKDVLKRNVYGSESNGITKLYAQLLAAKLNVALGASPVAIASTLTAADAFLATHDHADWNSLSAGGQNQVLSWQGILDDFNNGVIGPGHCQ